MCTFKSYCALKNPQKVNVINSKIKSCNHRKNDQHLHLSRCTFAKESTHRQMYPFTGWHFVIYCVHDLKNHENGISYPLLVKNKLMNHHRPISIHPSLFYATELYGN